MSGPLKSGSAQMTITVQGHEVTLYFSSVNANLKL